MRFLKMSASEQRGTSGSPIYSWMLQLVVLLCPVVLHGQPQKGRLLRDPGASAVLLDVATGRTIRSFGPIEPRAATPGSTLKPFVLLSALTAGTVRESTTVECRGGLTVDDHGHARNLACTHPRSQTIFAAREALAYSCNSYFARLAQRTPGAVLRRGLDDFGLHATGSTESSEARMLLALGLSGIQTTPAQLARAYRLLALRLATVRGPHEPLGVLRDGLLDSVRFGMADNAAVPGLELAGKTGTASQPGEPWTHGWFAGIVSGTAGAPARVLVVYVPHGSGAEAAGIAAQILSGLPR